MAERRMFSKSITESDAFLDLPFSAQTLYFHMAMNADDEGFINSSRRICGMCGATEDDLKTLCEKGFLICFDSGIYVIKHWKINNKMRGDRVKDTNYPEEKARLVERANGVYSLKKENSSLQNKEVQEEKKPAQVVEEVVKEIRQADRKSPIIIRNKSGHKIYETTEDYVPGPLCLLPVKGYLQDTTEFLIFFRKTKWIVDLLK